MKVNDRYCSMYYEEDLDRGTVQIDPQSTALLIIDEQYAIVKRPRIEHPTAAEKERLERWEPFYRTYEEVVIPNLQSIIQSCRAHQIEVAYAKIQGFKKSGADRSLVQKMTGFNEFLMTEDDPRGAIIEELAPEKEDIVVNKTTDSAITGTNLRLILHNMGIDTVIVTGTMTDQCVSGTVRDLSDESFHVWLIEDACLAATRELHEHELTVLNNIYCHVITTQELLNAIGEAARA